MNTHSQYRNRLVAVSLAQKGGYLYAMLAVLGGLLLAPNTQGETIYGVTVFRDLITFDNADPNTILSTVPITGLVDQNQFESVRHIDFRPATGELYAVGNSSIGPAYRLYRINTNTGVATQVGSNLNAIAASFGFNFDPLTDDIRIVTDDDQNLRYDATTAALISTDTALSYSAGDTNAGSNPTVVTGSYTNGFSGATSTDFYGIDSAKAVLVHQVPPDAGTLTTRGALGVTMPNYLDGVNLEISADSGIGYLVLSDPGGTGKSRLYRVNLTSGAATDFGEIGSNIILNGIALRAPAPETLPAIFLTKTGPSLPGTKIEFAATTEPGLSLRVQATTAPAEEQSWTDLPGGQMTENDPSNPGAGNYTLVTTAYPRANGIYFRALSSKKDFLDGKSDLLGSFDLRIPAAPEHGGLSETVFTVNELSSPNGNLADTVLRFAAVQTGTSANLLVRVQASTTPADEGSWTDLPNGRRGRMTFDVAAHQFVLNSTDYPLQNGVYFRAVASGSGFNDTVSNILGAPNGFDLATNKPHLGPTTLLVTANGPVADLLFLASAADVPAGIGLRIQSSTTPGDESSWSNLNGSGGSAMQQSTNSAYPKKFVLLANDLATAERIYFRAVASVPGSVDSLSNASGAFNLISDTPPVVQIDPKPEGLNGSGDGHDFDHPIVVAAGTLHFGATAQSSRPIASLKLLFDGSTVAQFGPGASSGSTDHDPNAIGDHVLEAIGVDDLGARARAGTAPVYIRVIGSGNSARKAKRGGELAGGVAESTGRTFTVATDNGVWTDASTWRDEEGNPGVPGPEDFAIVGSSTIRFGFAGEAKSVSINGGRLVGSATLKIHGHMTIAGAAIDGPMSLLVEQRAVCELLNPALIQFNPDSSGFRGNIINTGICNIHGSSGIVGTEQFVNLGILNFQTQLSIPPAAQVNPVAAARPVPVTTNAGLILSSSTVTLIGDGGGTLIGHDGATLIGDGGGTLIGDGGGTLIGHDGATLIGEDGASIAARGTGNFITDDGAGFLPSARRIRSTGIARIESSGYKQSAGQTRLDGISIIGPVAIEGGSLTGSGMIFGDVTNSAFVVPGHSAGAISVTGNYTQTGQGSLIFETAGPNPGQYDQLNVSGTATLDGKIEVNTINGYVPDPADTFSPLGYQSVNGSFSSVSGNTQLNFNANGALATTDPGIPNAPAPKALNISTRMRVEQGDNALIGGFIITGSASKKVIIRGLAPSTGVPGALADTTLELHKADGTTVFNDNWKDDQQDEIIATTIPPANDLESAIVATLPPGGHTAIVRGKGDTAGVGLVEVYDLEGSAPETLANISTRGLVQTGDDVMIGGFIIDGTQPATVLIRAIGPALSALGVAGSLQDPVLELHDKNGGTISNDNWRSTQETEIIATTVPPTDDREPAILATLVPDPYTAIVRGAHGTSGIAVVEAYNLQ